MRLARNSARSCVHVQAIDRHAGRRNGRADGHASTPMAKLRSEGRVRSGGERHLMRYFRPIPETF